MSFIKYMAAASANISQGIEIISKFSNGSDGGDINNDITRPGVPDFQVLLPEDLSMLNPEGGPTVDIGIIKPGVPDFQILLPDDPSVLRPSDGVGIFPIELRDQIIPMAEALPHMPQGTTALVIPQGVVPTVINGALTLLNEGEVTLSEGSSSYESEPAHSIDISGNNHEGHIDFLSESSSSQGSIITNDLGQIIGEGSAEYEIMIYEGEIEGSVGGLDYTASTNLGVGAQVEGNFIIDPLAGKIEAELDIGAQIAANSELSLIYEFPEGLGNAYANGHASAGATIDAEADLVIDLAEGTAELDAAFDAFAGVEAGFDAGIESELGDVGVSGGAYAGVGVSGELNAGYEDGKLTLGGSFGVAYGIGGHLGFEVTINVKEIVENAIEAAKDFGNTVKDIFSKETIDDMVSGINDAVEDIKDFAEDAYEFGEDAMDYLSDGFNNAADSISDYGNLLIESAEDFLNDAEDFVTDTWDDIKDTAEDTWNDVKDTVEDTWDDVTETVEGAWEDATEAAEETWEDVKDTAEDAWDAATDWLSGF